MSNYKKCAICDKKITKISTYCRKCSRIPLFNSKEKIERDNKIIDMYNDGYSTSELAHIFNFKSYNSILGVLKKYNVPINKDRHKYTFNEDLLDQDNSNKYYLLGLYAADGTISRNRNNKFIELSLNKKDKCLLNDIRKLFNTEKPLYKGKDNCLKFTLFSDKLFDTMVSFGIHERKSLTLNLTSNIPNEYILDFLRGYYDGDGSITGKQCADITLALTGSKLFANQIESLYKKIGYNVNVYGFSAGKKNTLYTIKKCGKTGLEILAKMYSNGGLFLPRKYEKFLKFTRLSIDEIMMDSAHNFAKRSTCIRRKVGCVITNMDRSNIVSIGYNGQAKGLQNHCESSLPGQCGCIHAEANALIKNTPDGKILYCTTMPCTNCAKLIINAKIKKIYFDSKYRNEHALLLFKKAGIKYKRLDKNKYNWKNDIADILKWKEK